MSELLTHIKNEMKVAMKSGDKTRLGVIRLILAAIKQIEVDERIELDDGRVLLVLDKMVKQRRESIRQYTEGNRTDLAEIEAAEITVIQTFLPQPLTEIEIDSMIAQAIADSNATSIKEMGKVMALLKEPMQGRADMSIVSAKIKVVFAE
jgi:uncharacterized protein